MKTLLVVCERRLEAGLVPEHPARERASRRWIRPVFVHASVALKVAIPARHVLVLGEVGHSSRTERRGLGMSIGILERRIPLLRGIVRPLQRLETKPAGLHCLPARQSTGLPGTACRTSLGRSSPCRVLCRKLCSSVCRSAFICCGDCRSRLHHALILSPPRLLFGRNAGTSRTTDKLHHLHVDLWRKSGYMLNLTQISGSAKLAGDELREMSAILPTMRPLLEKAFGTAQSEQLAKMGWSPEGSTGADY